MTVPEEKPRSLPPAPIPRDRRDAAGSFGFNREGRAQSMARPLLTRLSRPARLSALPPDAPGPCGTDRLAHDGVRRYHMRTPGPLVAAAGSTAAKRLRTVIPPVTPGLILRALLGVFLFFGGIVFGVWLIIRFRRLDRGNGAPDALRLWWARRAYDRPGPGAGAAGAGLAGAGPVIVTAAAWIGPARSVLTGRGLRADARGQRAKAGSRNGHYQLPLAADDAGRVAVNRLLLVTTE